MAKYQYQNAHGFVGISGDAGRYADTWDNFLRDYSGRTPELPDNAPEGVADHIYEPGRRHAYGDGEGSVIGGGPLVWAEGDAIINSLPNILSSQQVRKEKEYEAFLAAAEAQAEIERAAYNKKAEADFEKFKAEEAKRIKAMGDLTDVRL